MSTQTDLEDRAQRFFMEWPNGDIPAMVAAFASSLTQPKEGLEAENERLREVVQALVDGIVDNAKYRLLTEGEEGDTLHDFMNMTLNTALAAAKEQGFTPTNTEDK